MYRNRKIYSISYTVNRFISSSNTICKNYAGRESKFMTKLMKINEPKRKWYKDKQPNALNFHANLQNEKQPSVYAKRRMDVLNKLFMKHVTDIISTSEAASEFSERGIEITNVSISSDYKILNIFWTFEKVDNNNKNWSTTVEEILQKYSYILRHELSQMRVINYVPIMCFVKDKKLSLIREVESRLASLDFNDDYVETDDSTIQQDIINDNETDSFQITLPQMNHSVLGLDHHRIMSKIKNSSNKSKDCINKDTLDIQSKLTGQSLSTFINNKDISTNKSQQELFFEFLKKRKIEEKRKYRLKNNKHLEPTYRVIYNDDEDDDNNANTETYFDKDFDCTFTNYDESNNEFEKEKY